MSEPQPLGPSLLPTGVCSRLLAGVNGLRMHVLEAGHESPARPLLVLLHGFPEIGYSWRKVMPALAAAGFHVVAPDQRGYGRTTGWEPRDGEEVRHGILDWVGDVVALVHALGAQQAVVAGHDFGSQVAACTALLRPDLVRALVLMSSPFVGPPAPTWGSAGSPPVETTPSWPEMMRALAALPVPRKHYQEYFSTAEADSDMRNAPQGLHAFLRAYFHVKSADWEANAPQPLEAWTAEELAKLPSYYVMRAGETMPETVAHHAPSSAEIAGCRWLTEPELRVYTAEYARAGFRGALQFYRCRTSGSYVRALAPFVGRTIDMPACFISGRKDWGPYQKAGDIERMQTSACSRMDPIEWIDGAGHWVQQEQPDECVERMLQFLTRVGAVPDAVGSSSRPSKG